MTPLAYVCLGAVGGVVGLVAGVVFALALLITRTHPSQCDACAARDRERLFG